jgi:hypothetical protein
LLFYLNPPDWSCERGYRQNVFGRQDFERSAASLVGRKGEFLLSKAAELLISSYVA